MHFQHSQQSNAISNNQFAYVILWPHTDDTRNEPIEMHVYKLSMGLEKL